APLSMSWDTLPPLTARRIPATSATTSDVRTSTLSSSSLFCIRHPLLNTLLRMPRSYAGAIARTRALDLGNVVKALCGLVKIEQEEVPWCSPRRSQRRHACRRYFFSLLPKRGPLWATPASGSGYCASRSVDISAAAADSWHAGSTVEAAARVSVPAC